MRATIEFTSDWRVGTGGGRAASVDREVARDPAGLPFIPAKTLTGIWRDAAEELASALDAGRASTWSERVRLLFGAQPALGDQTTNAAKLVAIRPARLPAAILELLGAPHRAPLRSALTLERAAVRINERGVAVDDHVRFDEVTRQGLTLEAVIELDTDSLPAEERDRLAALLQASAVFIDGLGASRRRGHGACRVRLLGTGIDEDRLAQLLEDKDDAAISRAPTSTTDVETQSGRDVHERIDLALEVEAVTPLLVSPTVTGNVHTGSHSIPGSNLLGIVCDAIDHVLGRGVAAGGVRRGEMIVTSARPLIDGAPGRPVPACLARYKDGRGFDERGGVRNQFADSVDHADPETPVRQMKALRGGFVGALIDDDTLPVFREVVLTQRVHNSIDDDIQRPLSPEAGGTGGVYVYAAVPAGERFGATVRLSGTIAGRLAGREASLRETLTGPCRIGRSKRDDYGDAQLSATNKDEQPTGQAARGSGDDLSMWLLSDFVASAPVLGDALGEQLLADLRSALVGAGASPDLRLEFSTSTVAGDLPDTPRVALRATRIDGWHARWCLPRPSLTAIAAGSCAIVRVAQGDVSAESVARVMQQGIGQRTAEGLGEILLGDPLLQRKLAGRSPARLTGDAGSASEAALPDDADALACTLEDAACRRAIQNAAIALDDKALEKLFATGTRPSASQLSRLRNAANPIDGARERARSLLPRENDKPALERWAKKRWSRESIEELRRILGPGNEAELLDFLAPSGSWSWFGLTVTKDEDAARQIRLADAHADYAAAAMLDAIVRQARTKDET